MVSYSIPPPAFFVLIFQPFAVQSRIAFTQKAFLLFRVAFNLGFYEKYLWFLCHILTFNSRFLSFPLIKIILPHSNKYCKFLHYFFPFFSCNKTKKTGLNKDDWVLICLQPEFKPSKQSENFAKPVLNLWKIMMGWNQISPLGKE